MRLLIFLWLAVVQALVATPVADAPVARAAGVAYAARAVERGATGASVRAGGARPAREELRAARPVTGVSATRTDAASGHLPPAVVGGVPRPSADWAYAVAVRARTLEASHAVAARGAVLPYFPTAPPLQG